jgi:transposase
MPAPRKYSDELRERAVRMVIETLKDNPAMAHKRACHQVGEQLGIPGATLRNWFRSPSRSLPAASGSPAVDPAARVAELERENRELRRANAILKTASAFFAAELDRPPTR